MRSRYSAFAVGDAGYLLTTSHPATRPTRLHLDGHVRWTGVDVLATAVERGSVLEAAAEFCTHYLDTGRAGAQQETADSSATAICGVSSTARPCPGADARQ
jgi:SEC-C motif-containing protein